MAGRDLRSPSPVLYGVVDSPRLPGDVFTPSRKKGSKLYDPSSPRGPTAGQMLVPIKWPDSTLGRQPPRTPRTPKGKPVGNSAQIMTSMVFATLAAALRTSIAYAVRLLAR